MNLQDFFENIDREQQRVKQLPADFRPPNTSPQLAGAYPGRNATRGYLVGEGQDISDNPMAQAVTRRIMNQHLEWIQRYGVEAVMSVIDAVTAGEEDWEEIGSSDVSAYVNMVGDRLTDSAGSREEMRDRRPFAEQGVAEAFDPGRRRILAGMLGLAAQSIVPRSVASALTKELSAASVADDALERAALSLLNAIRWRLKQFEDDDYEGDGYGDEVRKIAGKLGMSPDQFDELMELYEYGSDPDDAAKELLRHLENVDPSTITVSDRDFDDYDDDDDDVVNPSTISKVANQAQTAAAVANQAQTAAAAAASFRNLLQRMMSRYLITAPPREKYMGRIEPTSSALALPAPDKTAAEIMRDLQDLMDRPLTDDEKEVVRQEIRTAQNKGVSETSDYSRRREREEAIIGGQKPARKKRPAQTSDYARRREREKQKEQGVSEDIIDKIRAKNYSRLAKRSYDKATGALDRAMDYDFSDIKNRDEHEQEFMHQMDQATKRETKAFMLNYLPKIANKKSMKFNEADVEEGKGKRQISPADRLSIRSDKGVAEGNTDIMRKVFKKNGEPVGEVGMDLDASPGQGDWYIKHYASGTDLSGYDSYAEAVEELKHLVKQGVSEAKTPGEFVKGLVGQRSRYQVGDWVTVRMPGYASDGMTGRIVELYTDDQDDTEMAKIAVGGANRVQKQVGFQGGPMDLPRGVRTGGTHTTVPLDALELFTQGVAEANFPGAPDVQMPGKQTPAQARYSKLHSMLRQVDTATPAGRQQAEKIIDEIQKLVDTQLPGNPVPSKKIWLSEQGVSENSDQDDANDFYAGLYAELFSDVYKNHSMTDQVNIKHRIKRALEDGKLELVSLKSEIHQLESKLKKKGVAEAGYNPLDDERREQRRMDQERAQFKRDELEAELGGEEQRYRDIMSGTWYILIDGRPWQRQGQPVTFTGRAAARRAGQTIKNRDPQKTVTITRELPATGGQGLTEIQQRLSQQFAAEDVLGDVRQRLGDMIQAKAERRARQMQRRQPPREVLGEPVRRIQIAPGQVLEIHGNEDDGFRIYRSGRSMPTRFATLEHAEIATRIYEGRLREAFTDQEYAQAMQDYLARGGEIIQEPTRMPRLGTRLRRAGSRHIGKGREARAGQLSGRGANVGQGGKPVVSVEDIQEQSKKDACYHKVKSRYKVWPSAYASGALVQCRKQGAKNWGKKSQVNEGWRDTLAAMAAAGIMALSGGGAAQAAATDTNPNKITATIQIDGQTQIFDLSNQGRDVKEASRWLEQFLDSRGIQGWTARVERGVRGSGNYERMNIDSLGGPIR